MPAFCPQKRPRDEWRETSPASRPAAGPLKLRGLPRSRSQKSTDSATAVATYTASSSAKSPAAKPPPRPSPLPRSPSTARAPARANRGKTPGPRGGTPASPPPQSTGCTKPRPPRSRPQPIHEANELASRSRSSWERISWEGQRSCIPRPCILPRPFRIHQHFSRRLGSAGPHLTRPGKLNGRRAPAVGSSPRFAAPNGPVPVGPAGTSPRQRPA